MTISKTENRDIPPLISEGKWGDEKFLLSWEKPKIDSYEEMETLLQKETQRPFVILNIWEKWCKLREKEKDVSQEELLWLGNVQKKNLRKTKFFQTREKNDKRSFPDKSLRVLFDIVSHPNTPIPILEKLATHPYAPIRSAIVKDPRTPENAIDKLAEDKNYYVKLEIARRGTAHRETLNKLVEWARKKEALHTYDKDAMRLRREAETTMILKERIKTKKEKMFEETGQDILHRISNPSVSKSELFFIWATQDLPMSAKNKIINHKNCPKEIKVFETGEGIEKAKSSQKTVSQKVKKIIQ